jgi:hypothetical protein
MTCNWPATATTATAAAAAAAAAADNKAELVNNYNVVLDIVSRAQVAVA